MKTSQEWWDETKSDPAKLNDWLQKQYTGEVTAAERIVEFSHKYAVSDRHRQVLAYIAGQERIHAEWIKELLENRGIAPVLRDPNQRYWKETLPGITDFESGAAVAYHAERMRLDRIRVIANDMNAPLDIVAVFQAILPDEEFHEKAFACMTSPEACWAAEENHEAGAAALGLVV